MSADNRRSVLSIAWLMSVVVRSRVVFEYKLLSPKSFFFSWYDMIKIVGRLYCYFNGNPYTNSVASSDVPSATNILIHSGYTFLGVAKTLMDGLLITHNIFTLWLEFS